MTNRIRLSGVALSVALGLGLAGAASPALAQDGGAALDRLLACDAEADAGARLACFDERAAQVRRMRQSAVRALEPRAARPARPAFSAVDSTVRAVDILRNGYWRVTLADGSVWQNSQPSEVAPQQGSTMSIRKGALGGLRATSGALSGVAVRPAS
ncbi:hypothetical protein [Sphingomonas corticis]|jgi:hypothetical protein|uniref:Uncharacterized protein n=1 Tax=Sphingomonas corticis TaxID=2722791 RepID=A0ABX1CQP0_9SPHN|nr:hypothetical protein [Sphingomonas corticis]NJR78682.1 hypothetical protein [Sphingomonas corticis]